MSIIPRPLPTRVVEPDVFEKRLLKAMFENVHSQLHYTGDVLCGMTPSFVARGIEMPAPLDNLAPAIADQIGETYYEMVATRWTLSYFYDEDDTAGDKCLDGYNFTFPIYTYATISREHENITVRITRSHITIKIGNNVLSVVVLNAMELMNLLNATSLYDFATIAFGTRLRKTGYVHDFRTGLVAESAMTVFFSMMSLGEEKNLMQEIIDILRYTAFVFLPFFSKQSRDIREDFVSAMDYSVL